MVKSLSLYGLKRISDKEARASLGIRTDEPLPDGWPHAQADAWGAWCRERGYFFARLDSSVSLYSKDSASVHLRVWLSEGPLLRVGSVAVLGSRGDLQSGLETRSGRPFSETVLERDIERIFDALENGGYPLARIRIDSLAFSGYPSDPRVHVVLHVDPGPEVAVGTVAVQGNRITRIRVVLRESRLKTGVPFSRKALLDARDNLLRTGYFQEVEAPDVLFIRDRAHVTLKVKEGNSNTFDAVAGYNPPAGEGRKGTVTGRLEFGFRNLLGTGRLLEVYWEKKDEQSQAMRLGYEEPWLFGRPVFPGIRFSQEIRDTTYIEREWRGGLRVSPWSAFSGSLEGVFKEILPDSVGSAVFGLAQTKSWMVSARLDYATLDEPMNPGQGVRYHSEFQFGRKRNLGPEALLAAQRLNRSVATRFVRVDAEAVLPVRGKQVLYAGVHGMEIRTGEDVVPLTDHIRFGGANTLRGYAEDAFRGTLTAWMNLEYRYRIGRFSRAFVFFDGGMYQRKERRAEGVVLLRGTKTGYGFGIRVETRLGLVGIDYGLGEGDGFLRGKVHVRLVNRF